MLSTVVRFDLGNGLSTDVEPIRRRLSEMAGMYADEAARVAMTREDDPLVYEFHDMGVPERSGAIAYGTSIV